MKRLITITAILLLALTTDAQTDTLKQRAADKPRLVVGYKQSPPFTMTENDSCVGVSMQLWEIIAKDLNVTYEFREYNFVDLLNAIENGEVDLCISPLTVTSERLRRFDFTQPFFTSNLAIAVAKKKRSVVAQLLSNFFSKQFFSAVFILIAVITMFGTIIWLVERKHKNSLFHNGVKGIGHGIWWSAVTMTTVGYGDKYPRTTAGRVLGVVWMFTSIIVISGLTGSIAASLTGEQSQNEVQRITDLHKLRTCCIRESNSDKVLLKNNIKHFNFDTIATALKAIDAGQYDAFLYDEPIIRYLVQEMELSDKIEIISLQSNSQYYSFALPPKHPLRDTLNIILIKELESLDWKGILNEYYIIEE